MTDASNKRKRLVATIHRELANAWACGAAAAQLPATTDPLELGIRAATRDRILTRAAQDILRAATPAKPKPTGRPA